VLHPQLAVADDGAHPPAAWSSLLAAAQPFQLEAYRELGEARLLVAPILAPAQDGPPGDLTAAVRYFHDRSAPSVVALPPGFDRPVDDTGGPDLRVLAAPSGGLGPDGLLDRLGAHHVVDDALARLADGRDPLAPCPRHLVLDERRDRVFPCIQAWRDGSPSAGHDPASASWPPEDRRATCHRCIARSALTAAPDLVASGRSREARELASQLALALAGCDQPALSADLAEVAAELAENDAARVAAFVHRGLSLLACGRLREADAALVRADAHTTDHGLIAYHRGRVQVAWRDDIEALERFEEVLAHPSQAVPAADVHLLMVQSHVRLEEYDEAREHLDAAAAPGREAVIAFFRGICDLNRDRPDAALAHFEAADRLGPEPDDLGRVLLYLGVCLARLERHEDAVAALRRAVDAAPDELAVHNQLGYCYYRLKRHEEAVACFRRAVELDPRSAIDWANLGSNLRDLGRTREAVEMYRRALALDPAIGFARESLERLEAR